MRMPATQAPGAEVHPAIRPVAEQVRAAHDARRRSRIVGAGTWMDAGRPVPDAVPLELGEVRGITEYVPGDLTLTALAGTSLAEVQEATRANGQRLALDPYGTDAGTLGATVATASAGPLAAAYGGPRDTVLGLTFVSGTGEVASGGGRVVKNVAGFDLVRLLTGSWGTLGAIVEVSLRLRALPAADETWGIALDEREDAVIAAVTALRALPFTFDALELLDPTTARQLGVEGGAGGAILARGSGTAATVHAMRAALATVGTVRTADAQHWAALRALEPAGAACIRLSHRPTEIGAVWRGARQLADAAGGWAHLAIGRTVARVTVPAHEAEANDRFGARIETTLAHALSSFDGTCVAERLPGAAWSAVRRPAPSAARIRLTQGVRSAFDPARLLNPGILGADGGEG